MTIPGGRAPHHRGLMGSKLRAQSLCLFGGKVRLPPPRRTRPRLPGKTKPLPPGKIRLLPLGKIRLLPLGKIRLLPPGKIRPLPPGKNKSARRGKPTSQLCHQRASSGRLSPAIWYRCLGWNGGRMSPRLQLIPDLRQACPFLRGNFHPTLRQYQPVLDRSLLNVTAGPTF